MILMSLLSLLSLFLFLLLAFLSFYLVFSHFLFFIFFILLFSHSIGIYGTKVTAIIVVIILFSVVDHRHHQSSFTWNSANQFSPFFLVFVFCLSIYCLSTSFWVNLSFFFLRRFLPRLCLLRCYVILSCYVDKTIGIFFSSRWTSGFRIPFCFFDFFSGGINSFKIHRDKYWSRI